MTFYKAIEPILSLGYVLRLYLRQINNFAESVFIKGSSIN